MPRNKGKVYLIGAGPGDLELITLKGLRYLKEAQVVIYDRLVNPKLLKYVHPKTEVVYVGKSSVKHTLSQDKINRLLLKKAKEAKIIVRLKGGDPFLFGRGAEEVLFLAKHKIPFEVVPGITSALAVPAYAGIPLTHRDYTSTVGIFTGHKVGLKKTSGLNWQKISTGLGTLVFLMGVENLSEIVKNLIKYGRAKSTPCGLIQNGTLSYQRTLVGTLGTILKKVKEQNFKPPAILVVGEVVSLRDKLNWYENKPLFGRRILITRPTEFEGQSKFVKILEDLGASCIELPVAEIKPLDDYTQLDSAIKQIQDFQWIIFTSQNGVKFFKQRLDYLKKDVSILKDVNIAAIGPKTKLALENLGLKVDIAPKEFCQEGLLTAFKKEKIKGKNILLVRALEARELLPKELKKIGAKVKIAPAYKTVTTSPRHNITTQDLRNIDVIIFTSSSCVKNFFQILPKGIFKRIKKRIFIASIGPVTSQAVREFGLKPDIEAKSYTLDGLAEAIVRYYR